jgi:predicted metal-binding membrane protein
MKAAEQRSYFLLTMGGLIALAWLALALWAKSPYGRFLDHGGWTEVGLAAGICAAVPAGEILVPALLYVSGWALMLSAMMLPTTFPLLEIFRRVTAGRADQRTLISLLIVGYLAAWGLFGLASHVLDLGLHAFARQSAWLALNAWVLGVAVLAIAGMFQFSALKYRCLDKCRTPLSFVIAHWRGKAEARQALLLGLRHGMFCVGCCWAIMLLMFVVGTGSVGWMLALGAVMAVEKNMPWGRKLSAPLGAVLLATAAVLLAHQLYAAAA